MPRSLFDPICPECGGDIELAAPGEGSCQTCQVHYLVRVGHVMPDPRSAMHTAGSGGPR
jgi:hypothetical protein